MDTSKPTALMMGRFQYFHPGHRALFEEALREEGQVLIAVRDTHSPGDESNPFNFDEVKRLIEQELIQYTGLFDVVLVPNITNVVYGRGVGYKITRVTLPPEIEAISATEIRRKASVV